MRDTGEHESPQHANKVEQKEPEATDESPEKAEERKLMEKFGPGLAKRGGHTALIKNRMATSRKFFDSGDYNLQKQGAAKSKALPPHLANLANKSAVAPLHEQPALDVQIVEETSPTSPTNETPPTVTMRSHPSDDGNKSPTNIEGLEIPKPNTVPQRKSSIIYPMAASKLSPQPLLHQLSQPVEQLTGDDCE